MGGGGIPRQLYVFNQYCRTKIIVKGDPYAIYESVIGILAKQLGANPVKSNKGKFKVKFSK